MLAIFGFYTTRKRFLCAMYLLFERGEVVWGSLVKSMGDEKAD